MSKQTLPPEVLEALRKGNKIEAVKRLREAAKIGLAEAKGRIDTVENAPARRSLPVHVERPLPTPAQVASGSHLGPGEVPPSSSGSTFMAIAIAAAAFTAWWYLR